MYSGMSILIGGCLVVVYCPCDSGGTDVCCGMVVADSVVVMEVVADSVVEVATGRGVLGTSFLGVAIGISILKGGLIPIGSCSSVNS